MTSSTILISYKKSTLDLSLWMVRQSGKRKMQLVCLLEDVPIVELQMHVFLSINLGGKNIFPSFRTNSYYFIITFFLRQDARSQ